MDTSPLSAVPEPLRAALEARGFTTLTPVQIAVLGADPDRDLRISSQTGSGKTVAFGLALGRTLGAPGPQGAAPRALVMVPTRELAQQVRRELAWLLAPLSLRVLSVTGGTSVWGDLRALEAGCDVLVGTPGRLADHVRSRNVNCADVEHVILDEADEMLDMGFAEELSAVLDAVPPTRRTHLVSATFPAAVRSLADRYQSNPLPLQGTPLGDPNADIDHLIHVVLRDERLDALINLLLTAPDESTLVFVRTREGAAELVRILREAGFGALLLTGDLDQKERQRTLEMFRAGRLRILVATDVAARGLDVPGITRVIHSDPPEDPDAYIHRSGRTGRAGRKGKSHVLIPREARPRVLRLLSHARVTPRFAPIPDPDAILRAAEDRITAAMLEDDGTQPDEATERLAKRLLEQVDPRTLVARLLTRPIPSLPAEPRTVTPVAVDRNAVPALRDRDHDRDQRPRRDQAQEGFVRFQVSWGSRHGADPRRVLALLCRRGNITKAAIGAILVGPLSSFVEVRADVADAFEVAAQQPDPRDPRVRVRRFASEAEAPPRPSPYPSRRPPPGPRDERPNRRPLPPPPPEPPSPHAPDAPRAEALVVEAPPAARKSKPVVVEAPPAARKSKPVVVEAPPAARKSKPVVVEAPPAARKSKSAVEVPPAARESAPQVEAPPAARKSKPVADAPPARKSAPQVEAPPAARKSKPVVVEAPPAARKSKPAVEAPPAARKSKPVTDAPPTRKRGPAAAPPPVRKTGPFKRVPREAAPAEPPPPERFAAEAPAEHPRKTGFHFKKDSATPARGPKKNRWTPVDHKPKRRG